MYSTIAIERRGQIAILWMNRPELFNALDEVMIAELAAACSALDGDSSARVVVLAGRGKHFSAGADLNWMKRAASYSEAENLADARRFAAMLQTLASLRKPTIARVHGAALGGGTGIAAACDITIAGDDAQFATSEVKFGIIPAVISPYVLRAIGPRHALRYFQSGERISAARAHEIGLVSEVVHADKLDTCIQDLAESLLAGAPGAQSSAKDLIRAIAERPLTSEIVEETATRIACQRATIEAKEGICAFLEKRRPAWIAGG